MTEKHLLNRDSLARLERQTGLSLGRADLTSAIRDMVQGYVHAKRMERDGSNELSPSDYKRASKNVERFLLTFENSDLYQALRCLELSLQYVDDSYAACGSGTHKASTHRLNIDGLLRQLGLLHAAVHSHACYRKIAVARPRFDALETFVFQAFKFVESEQKAWDRRSHSEEVHAQVFALVRALLAPVGGVLDRDLRRAIMTVSGETGRKPLRSHRSASR